MINEWHPTNGTLQAPWYLNATEGSGLKHQKDNKDHSFMVGSEARKVTHQFLSNKKVMHCQLPA